MKIGAPVEPQVAQYIKFCGMTSQADIAISLDAGVNALGQCEKGSEGPGIGAAFRRRGAHRASA